MGIYDGVAHHPAQEAPSQNQIWPRKTRLNRLALDMALWTEPFVNLNGTEVYNPDHMLLFIIPLRELLIVVAKPSVYCPSKIMLVEPTYSPVYHRDALYTLRVDLYATSGPLLIDYRFNWEKAARRLENVLSQVKEKRGVDRKREIEGMPPFQTSLSPSNDVYRAWAKS